MYYVVVRIDWVLGSPLIVSILALGDKVAENHRVGPSGPSAR